MNTPSPAPIESAVIELNRLCFIGQREGRITTDTVKIDRPTACTHPNGHGELARFKTLTAFRKSAKDTGSQFRKALNPSVVKS